MKRRPILYLSFLGAVALTAMAWQGFPRLRRQPSPSTSLKYGPRDPALQGSPVSAQTRLGLVPDSRSQARFATNLGRIPLSFEANQGQTDERIKFLSRGRGYTLFLAGNQAVLALRKNRARGSLSSQAGLRGPWSLGGMRNSVSTDREKFGPLILLSAGRDSAPLSGLEKPQGRAPRLALQERAENASVLRMELVGADPRAMAAGLDPLPGKSNYFIGNDPKKWRTNVPNYAKVKYRDVYPGVDLVYYGNQGQLEYDFVVRPGADPKAIKMTVRAGFLSRRGRLQGAPPQIDTNGDLVFGTESEVRLHKPVVYQPLASGMRLPVDAHYSLKGDEASFELALYDRDHPLVIDPVLSYSTYLGSSDLSGGSNLDTGYGIAVDSGGNAYLTGFTNSADFPTLNPFQATSGGGYDVFITKLNPTGSALVYSTYLGGSGNDRGAGIAVDSSGNVYVTGFTESTNFPTLNPFQATSGGGKDAFVTKLNPTGNALVYSTYLGGSGNEIAAGIAVDSSGNAYVTGPTDSTNFPTLNPFQATSGGGNDVFVTKLNPTGNALVYSTYLGGSGNDGGAGIAVDSSGNAYVTGSTASLDFPTFNALQASLMGNFDAFVAKLDTAGTALAYSTYFGSYDIGNAIAVDSSGNAYVTGWVQPFPGNIHSSNAIETCGFGIIPNFDAFVTELKPDGTGSVFSTCLGGDLDTAGFAIALDSSGSAYVTGCTDSAVFTTTSQAFQRTGGGGDCTVYNAGDAFVAKISPTDANAVSLAPSSIVFPPVPIGTTTTSGLVQKLLDVGTAPLTISGISITGANSGDFAFQPSGGLDCSTGLTLSGGGACNINVSFTPTAQGARAATVTVTDNAPDSPQAMTLSGTGKPPSAATLSAAALSFGNDIVGVTSAPQTLTVTSSGSANLVISTVSVAGTNALDFTKQSDSCTGASVPPSTTCSVMLVFKPSVPGAENGILTITDNASNSPQTVSLSGSGNDFSLGPASGAPTSTTVTAGQTATLSLQVNPISGFTGTVNLACAGTPAQSTCTPSTSSVNVTWASSVPFSVTVTTMARGLLPPGLFPRPWPHTPQLPLLYAVPALICILSTAVKVLRRDRSRLACAWTSALVVCLGALITASGCNGGGSSSPSPPSGTPAGTYTLTATGTSQGVSRTVNLTLKVN